MRNGRGKARRRLTRDAVALVAVLMAGGSARAQTSEPDACAPYSLSNGVLVCNASGSVRQQLRSATFIAGSQATGEALAQATAVELATAPIGSSSGGFTYRFDPRTQERWSRTSGSFGPSFAERALTIGRGKISGGVNFIHRTYDQVDGLDLEDFAVMRFQGGSLPVTASTMSVETTSTTVAAFGHYGVRDNLDVGVMVPFVGVMTRGEARIFDEAGDELQRVGFDGSANGIGDIAIFAKYRFLHLGPRAGVGADPNADLALATMLRLPSGDPDEMLGLGVTRVSVTFVASVNMRKVTPHVNIGYEFWSGSIDIPVDFRSDSPGIFVQDQVQYAAGTEYELHPRLTVVADLVGRYQRGGARLGYQRYDYPTNRFNVEGAEALIGVPYGFNTVMLVPGAKWNFHDAALLTANVLIAVTNGGLTDRVTPVVGIDWGF
jgi:hypothetical protein